jgi:hypothetical protein
MQNLCVKDKLIYEKKNSITDELCNDIINIFDNNYNLTANSNCYNITYNPNYSKIKDFLKKELDKNLRDYDKKCIISLHIKHYQFVGHCKSSNIQKCEIQMYEILKKCNKEFVFYIEKNKSKDNFNYTNRVSIGSTNIKILIFMWFLNDCDSEIIFWDEYKIIPKAGNFIMFPISWCFPYQELVNLQNDKYIIYGYIYTK